MPKAPNAKIIIDRGAITAAAASLADTALACEKALHELDLAGLIAYDEIKALMEWQCYTAGPAIRALDDHLSSTVRTLVEAKLGSS